MATIAGGRSAKQDATASHPYSCNTCQVAFRNSDLQKNHMKGDWHRYNLKRRVASLPPISSELFAEKVIQSQATTAAQAGKASFERVCDVCQKTYYSQNSFRNHISSQKHKAREVAAATRGLPAKDGDEASSVMSSTFSLGEPHQTVADTDSQIVDSDAEEEFTHVVEGLKKATLEGGVPPVKRPANPRLSAAGQHKGDHPLAYVTNGQASDASAGAGAGTGGDAGAEAGVDASTDTAATPTPSKSIEPPHSLKLCLFCNYASPTVALSIAHMERFHGMFIPEKQYLVDLDGLLAFLQTRIRDDHECIFCGKIRSDVFAVQTHMRDKAHCTIPYMTLEEQVDIGEFYDFRGTYSDGESDSEDEEEEEEETKRSRAKLGAKRSTKTTAQDGTSGEGDGWETDSSASSLDSADLTAVPGENHYHQYDRLGKHPHHSQTDPRAHHQTDGWHSHAHKHNHAVFYDEYELHLPSGRAVGHRSLNRYFRQNLHNYPSIAEREKQMQLAIEAGVEFDEDDEIEDDDTATAPDAVEVDGDANGTSSALTRTNQPRQVVSTRPPPRNTLGLAGVSDKTKTGLRKSERKSAMAKIVSEDRDKIRQSAKSIGQSFRFLGR